MSFSSGVKEELSRKLPKARHCQLAECAALLGLCGTIRLDEHGQLSLLIRTENVTVARTFYMLLREAFGIRPEIRISRSDAGRRKRIYVVAVGDHGKTRRILEAVKMIDDQGEVGEDYRMIRSGRNSSWRSWGHFPSRRKRLSENDIMWYILKKAVRSWRHWG